jgi:putative endonuclease
VSSHAGRRAAWGWGRIAEGLAAWTLRCKGYRIDARNLRTPVGEVDIVARRGSIVAFVEVKARRSMDEALAAIQPRQRERIVRTAEWYVAGRGLPPSTVCRFDAFTVAPWRIPRHIIDAWRADETAARR